jgi:hypothetical protein
MNALPQAGGLFDQSNIIVRGIMMVLEAENELQEMENAKLGAQTARMEHAARR